VGQDRVAFERRSRLLQRAPAPARGEGLRGERLGRGRARVVGGDLPEGAKSLNITYEFQVVR